MQQEKPPKNVKLIENFHLLGKSSKNENKHMLSVEKSKLISVFTILAIYFDEEREICIP